ncbi:Zn(II)2Cys6 domain-containing transcription factor nscR [Aspergillus undulatus]|uniref:Zn(II)2Cys6 domain-containing transcription factor nscR n=1 Tax=Aspergillus undulatus TaxID=1810928 RepID=UPI003CCCF4E0
MGPEEQAVPQLSCALCRNRKLKCDKLDPCTNCTSSGVVCSPVYRPRLPRGRHARTASHKSSSTNAPPSTIRRRISSGGTSINAPASNESDRNFGARIDRLESLVQGGETSKVRADVETNGLQDLMILKQTQSQSSVENDRESSTAASTHQIFGSIGTDLWHRVRRLEGLVQESGCGSNNASNSTKRRASPETLTNELEMQQAPASTEFAADMWADLMDHEMHDQPQHGVEEMSSESMGGERTEATNNGIGALRLLGVEKPLSLSSAVLPRDKATTRKLCQVYLQNVDPIIKLLHRPSLSKWLQYGGSYLGLPDDDLSVRALESAVCYAAANTMTETQCQKAFQKSKKSVITTHRKMCEDGIERAGLLTTRDITVLQAFILYLIGRRTEERGTAVWALLALAVRLTSALGQEARSGESFFQQQARLRLWLTVCLLDLQASFAQGSEPLINYQDAASAVPLVAHINDSDFDVDTSQPVASHEELTDTTFALVTYYAQIPGRLLNFATPEPSTSNVSASSSSSTDSLSLPVANNLADAKERHKLSRQFEQQVFTLLHYCDTESSPYAWFTWHSTQSIVAAIRLSELLPFRCGRMDGCRVHSPPPSPAEGDPVLLLRALQSLEKAQLICSDSRGDGFRWYITTPWLALFTAITECATCTDKALVRRAWPVVETLYRQYEEASQAPARVPLEQAMRETQSKFSPSLQSADAFNNSQGDNSRASDRIKPRRPVVTTRTGHDSGKSSSPIDSSMATGDCSSLTTASSLESENTFIESRQQVVHPSWNLASMSIDDVPALDTVITTSGLYDSFHTPLLVFDQPRD